MLLRNLCPGRAAASGVEWAKGSEDLARGVGFVGLQPSACETATFKPERDAWKHSEAVCKTSSEGAYRECSDCQALNSEVERAAGYRMPAKIFDARPGSSGPLDLTSPNVGLWRLAASSECCWISVHDAQFGDKPHSRHDTQKQRALNLVFHPYPGKISSSESALMPQANHAKHKNVFCNTVCQGLRAFCMHSHTYT